MLNTLEYTVPGFEMYHNPMTNVGSATIGQAVLPNLTLPVVPQLQNLDLVIKVAGDAKSGAPIGGKFWQGN